MTEVLIIDASAHVRELFGQAIRDQLGFQVDTLADPTELTDAMLATSRFDIAVVDLLFPGSAATGADALLKLHLDQPATKLVVLTDGDQWSSDLLRDTWEVLDLAAVICTASPIATQLEMIAQVAAESVWQAGSDGSSSLAVSARIDPMLAPLLPNYKSPWRTLEGFSRLVQHRGHAKLWQAVLACGPVAEYQDLAAFSGLRLNALRNYRAQLLPELSLHGLHNPPMRDLYRFANRCRPFLAPFVEAKGFSLDVQEGARSAIG